MAFIDFTFPRVQKDLGLTVDEADLDSRVHEVPLREEFAAMIVEGPRSPWR